MGFLEGLLEHERHCHGIYKRSVPRVVIHDRRFSPRGSISSEKITGGVFPLRRSFKATSNDAFSSLYCKAALTVRLPLL